MTTYTAVLRNGTFRVLLGTRTLNIIAGTLRLIALSLLVYATTGSPALAALAYGIGFLPQLLGAGLFGALADRVRPRRLIVLGYLAEAGATVLLAAVPLPVWGCLALVATVALLTPIFAGAQNSLIAEALAGDTYVLGRSLANMASSLAQLAGMAGAGLAVAALGGRRAMLLAALGHAVAAAWTRLGLANTPAVSRVRGGLAAASWRGNLELLRDRTIRRLLLIQWLPPAFITGAEALMVPYAAGRGFPIGVAGWLLAAVPVGMIAGDLVVARLVRPAWRERLVPILIALMGLPCLAFAAPVPWLPLAAALVVVGAGFAYSLGVQEAFRDALPAGGRGQAFGLLTTGLMTAQGLLPALAGLLAEALPAGAVIGLLGAATLLSALGAAPGLVRRQDRGEHRRAAEDRGRDDRVRPLPMG
ncbi:MFS transporter [Dactylosporangium sp. NPDC000555]|uniref:MFS transporter n=1 Tax=Dactylosporangium sp. NPDC000555 TaxID=3154260 RepID=UPI003330705A